VNFIDEMTKSPNIGQALATTSYGVPQIRLEIDRAKAEQLGVPDFRVIDFKKWEAPVADLIRGMIERDEIPAVLVCSSFGPAVNTALDVLIPHADRVTKAMRG
jgi:hypothetical protein